MITIKIFVSRNFSAHKVRSCTWRGKRFASASMAVPERAQNNVILHVRLDFFHASDRSVGNWPLFHTLNLSAILDFTQISQLPPVLPYAYARSSVNSILACLSLETHAKHGLSHTSGALCLFFSRVKTLRTVGIFYMLCRSKQLFDESTCNVLCNCFLIDCLYIIQTNTL